MIRTYRHPEQKPALSEVEWGRGLPSRYLKGLVTVILRLHSGTTFHLKKAGGPDVFPHSPFRAPAHPSPPRSEEHTSELQSRGHLVCRLLLEKKKHTHKHTNSPPTRYKRIPS